jgi:hypothetical protein
MVLYISNCYGFIEVLGSNLGRDIGFYDSLLLPFSSVPPGNEGIVLLIGHDRFLPSPF